MDAPCFDDFTLSAATPLQVQLCEYLRERITSGQLRRGMRLPSSRQIAADLQLSRNTVVASIDQLKAEGYLSSHVGKGVFVDARLPDQAAVQRTVSWQRTADLPSVSHYGRRSRKQAEVVSGGSALPFTMGVPDLDAFPLSTWSRLQRRHLDRRSLLGYDGYQGYQLLREALADYLRVSRKVNCVPEQILICNGAQQALSMVAAVLLNRGDEVLVENPGYLRARQAFESQGARLRAAPVGPQGVRVRNLPEQGDAKLLYVTPTHQYPLGGILPLGDRLELLDWAMRSGTWIIEDDYDSEFHFFNKPVAALQGMADQTPVLYTGSFSKTLFPALRIGYLVLPDALMDSFKMAKSHMAGESSLLEQATLADFIAEGHFLRHIRKMRRLYEDKWLHMQAQFDLANDARVTLLQESAGMHLVAQIDDIDDVLLAEKMAGRGFGGAALSQYYMSARKKTGITLGYANSSARQREEGVAALHELLMAPCLSTV